MCMKYIVVSGFPTQTNLKENAVFNRNFPNSYEYRYGCYHWESLKASLSTMSIERECANVFSGFHFLRLCICLFYCIIIYDWMAELKSINDWSLWLVFFFILDVMTWEWGRRAKDVTKLVLFNKVFPFVPHKLNNQV